MDTGSASGTPVGGGGGAWGPRRGTHFLEGDVLSFTTLKRFCSSFSPQ